MTSSYRRHLLKRQAMVARNRPIRSWRRQQAFGWKQIWFSYQESCWLRRCQGTLNSLSDDVQKELTKLVLCWWAWYSLPRDFSQERHERWTGFLDHVEADQGPVSDLSIFVIKLELLMLMNRMGSTSMASGPGGKSTIKGLGQNVEQKTAGGCC